MPSARCDGSGQVYGLTLLHGVETDDLSRRVPCPDCDGGGELGSSPIYVWQGANGRWNAMTYAPPETSEQHSDREMAIKHVRIAMQLTGRPTNGEVRNGDGKAR